MTSADKETATQMSEREPDSDSTETGTIQDLFKNIPEDDINSQYEADSSSSKRTLFQCCYVPKRHILTCLTAIGMLLTFAMRTNVAVTVVMILDEEAHEKVHTVKDFRELHIPRLHWDSRMIGFLHSIFYVGYFVTQIPGAYFTTIWPNHKIYGVCILLSSLLNLLLPISIQMAGFSVTCVVRCLQGMAEGLLYPACYGVLRHWSTPANRNRQVSAVLTCAYAGVIVGFPAGGLATHFLGWKYIYYISGGSCILWYLVWLGCSYEKPSHHSTISDHEFEYLEKEQGDDVIDYENIDIPWRSIMTSLSVWSICLCHFAWHWVFILMLTNQPLYLNMFGFNIAETGFYASVPHIAKVALSFASGIIADALLNTAVLTTTAVRKMLTGIGLGILAICIIVLTQLYAGTAVIIVLSVALGAFGFSTSGWLVNHYDLSTRYASTLVAVTSSFGTIGAIVVPVAVGDLTINQVVSSTGQLYNGLTACAGR